MKVKVKLVREEDATDTDTDRVSDHSRGKISCCLSLFAR